MKLLNKVMRHRALTSQTTMTVVLVVLMLTACDSGQEPVGNQTVVAPAVPVAAVEPTAANTPVPATFTPTPTRATRATPDLRPPLERTLNLLLLGSDQRPNEPNWRTDVMMIVAVDLVQQRVGVVSIPRDLFLDEIPNHRANRINVVDYLGEQDEPNGGGPALMAKILADRMDVRIDAFVRFDFASFSKIIDAIGGIDVEVDCAYADSMAGLYLQPGRHTMDGALALKYVRSRYTTSDLDRARRQQQVIWAVRQSIANQNLLPRIPAIYTAVADAVDTDIDLVTTVRLIRFALGLEPDRVYRLILAPPDYMQPGWRLGMSVFVADWPAITHAVQRIFERPPMTAAEIAGAQGQQRTCY